MLTFLLVLLNPGSLLYPQAGYSRMDQFDGPVQISHNFDVPDPMGGSNTHIQNGMHIPNSSPMLGNGNMQGIQMQPPINSRGYSHSSMQVSNQNTAGMFPSMDHSLGDQLGQFYSHICANAVNRTIFEQFWLEPSIPPDLGNIDPSFGQYCLHHPAILALLPRVVTVS
jgi:hypothetical protein